MVPFNRENYLEADNLKRNQLEFAEFRLILQN